jgi:hypothetical protein
MPEGAKLLGAAKRAVSKASSHSAKKGAFLNTAPALILVVERKSDLEGDLVVRHPAVFNMAARLHYLEPADCRNVLAARPTAFWIASSMLFCEEPATWMIR